jgi:hypothetical protein
MDPKAIIEQSQVAENFIGKEDFIRILLDQIGPSKSDDKNILDYSDFDSLSYSPEYLKHIIDTLDVVSLSSLFPNVSFEVSEIPKLKIASIPLSHLLINKPSKE